MKILVVGGGAAGMMAAITAAENGGCVTLLEKNDKLGKKIFITGKGRCNVTNDKDTVDFFNDVVSNPKFLYSSVYSYDSYMVKDFFESNGCKLKTERGERVFPVSDHSSDIIRTLENKLKELKVKVIKNANVRDLVIKNGIITGVVANIGKTQMTIAADKIILACGGKSYKSTGSDGYIHEVLSKYGIKIVTLKPALVPLVTKEDWCRQLMGLSLKNVSLKVLSGKKEIYNGFGEMLFTHFGISGPLVLSASSYISKYSFEHECDAYIDLKPALDEDVLDKRILRDFEANINKTFKNAIGGLLPAKMLSIIPDLCDIQEDKKVNEITKEERMRLVRLLKAMPITIVGMRDFNEAIVTQGGVDVKEINPSTMESLKIKNLFFAGEMIDVDAMTGGFNLQIAWSTGHLAGENVVL